MFFAYDSEVAMIGFQSLTLKSRTQKEPIDIIVQKGNIWYGRSYPWVKRKKQMGRDIKKWSENKEKNV